MKKIFLLTMAFFISFTSVKAQIDEQMLVKAKQFGLGNPKSETPRKVATGAGFYQRFTGGNVYYNPTTQSVYAVYGDILIKWGELKWENGELGFPTSDEKDSDKAGWKRMNTFDKGNIYWRDGETLVVKHNRYELSNKPSNTPYNPSGLQDPLGYVPEIEVYVSIVENAYTDVEIQKLVTGNDPKIKVLYYSSETPNKRQLKTNGTVYRNIENGYLVVKYNLAMTKFDFPSAIVLTIDDSVLKQKSLTLNGDGYTIGQMDPECQGPLTASNIFNLPIPGYYKMFDKNKKGCDFIRKSDKNKVYRFHIDPISYER